jgi:hypothetical protein
MSRDRQRAAAVVVDRVDREAVCQPRHRAPKSQGLKRPRRSEAMARCRGTRLIGRPEGEEMSDETPGAIAPDGEPRRAAAAPATPGAMETTPAVPSSWPEPTPAPARKTRLRAAILGVGAVVVVLGGKIVLGLAAGAVVGSAVGAFFGGPFERLPSDQRSQFDTRLTAAVGSTFNGLSDTDKKARILAMLEGGLPRLSDPILIERVSLFTTALHSADTATCAAVARGSLLGKPDATAADKVIGGLDTTPFGRWVEINIEAIEAEKLGAIPARTVSSAASDALYASLFDSLTPTDTATITAVTGGGTATDADACAALRNLYGSGKALGSADLANFALLDVSQ